MNIPDGIGNYIVTTKNKPWGNVKVDLFLKRTGKMRPLGVINIQKKTLHVREALVTDKVLGGKKAYAFCFYLIQNARLFDKVCIVRANKPNRTLSNEYILEQGQVFAQYPNGFDVNIYVLIDKLPKTNGSTNKN